jgi:hypothetical protein
VLLLHLCGWRMKNLSHMTNLNVWMKNGWNDNCVTNLNVSHMRTMCGSRTGGWSSLCDEWLTMLCELILG